MYDLAEELTRDGVDANVDALDSHGMTPLMWALRRRDFEKAHLLLKAGADPNICENTKRSALLYAVRSSADLECVVALLRAGANPAQTDEEGFNALHIAAEGNDNRDLIRCLVDAGTDVNGGNWWGVTPLFHTAFHNHVISAHTLLDCGAKIDALDNDADSALFQSIFLHADDVVHLLLARGASYTSPNGSGYSILHCAGRYGGNRTLGILQAAHLKNIDPEAFNREGQTAMQVALSREGVEDGFIEKMQELIAEIHARDNSSHEGESSTQAVNDAVASGGTFGGHVRNTSLSQ